MRALAAALVATALFTLRVEAQACAPGEAGERFDEAQDAYEAGDLPLAATLLERSIACEEAPEALYDLYVVREQLHQWGAAADALESYLESEAPMTPGARTDLEGWLLELRDREHPEEAPAPIRLEHDPGWQIAGGVILGAGIAGILAFGVTGALALQFRGQACELTPCDASQLSLASDLELAAWTSLAIGAALAIGGLVLTLVALSWTQGSAESLPPGLDPSRPQWQPLSFEVDVGAGFLRTRLRF